MFLAVGRGRRPSLPRFDITAVSNLTWLQLYQLKLEFGSSWNAAARWVTLLFQGLPSLNARHQMERAACGFAKTDHKEAYIALTVNLDSIGPFCTGLGIFRSTVADGASIPSVRGELGNGAILELAALYVPAHEILNCLFPDISADDWKVRINKIRVQKTRLKSKNITKLGEYLVEKVTVEGVSVGVGDGGVSVGVGDGGVSVGVGDGGVSVGVGDGGVSVGVGDGGVSVGGGGVSVGVGDGGVSVGVGDGGVSVGVGGGGVSVGVGDGGVSVGVGDGGVSVGVGDGGVSVGVGDGGVSVGVGDGGVSVGVGGGGVSVGGGGGCVSVGVGDGGASV